MASAKLRTIVLWTLAGLLAALFLMSGSGKLLNAEASTPVGDWDAQFVDWGFPAWARWIVGFAEVAGAIGLVVPAVRFYAATGLVALMVGAVGTHIVNGEGVVAVMPFVLAVLAGVVAWGRKPEWVGARLVRTPQAA